MNNLTGPKIMVETICEKTLTYIHSAESCDLWRVNSHEEEALFTTMFVFRGS